MKFGARKQEVKQQRAPVEEEAKGEFNLMKPEDLVLRYRPEDYSINERILNAKFVAMEQEKTKKVNINKQKRD